MPKTEILDKVNASIVSMLEGSDFYLVEAKLRLQQRRWRLSLLVDRVTGGITLDECAGISRKINEIIEQENLLEQNYLLDIASPGLDRPLVSKQDFLRCLKRKIRAFFEDDSSQIKEAVGVIVSVGDTELELDCKGKIQQIAFEEIRNAKQIIEEV